VSKRCSEQPYFEKKTLNKSQQFIISSVFYFSLLFGNFLVNFHRAYRAMKRRIRNILSGTEGIKTVRRNALIHIFTLFIALPGRINFLAMARHGRFSEKTYRNHFERVLKSSNFVSAQGCPVAVMMAFFSL